MLASGFRRHAAAILERTGRILMRGIEPDAAALAFRAAARIDAGNLPAHQALSAIQHSRGETDTARQTIEEGVRAMPFIAYPAPPRPAVRVLAVRTLEGGHYMVQQRHNRELKAVLRGVNITTHTLIDRQRFALTDFYILGDNLLHFDGLPTFDIIVNTVSDPDRGPAALGTLAAFIDRHPGIPVINHPDRIWGTTRDANARRFEGRGGFLFPKTVRVPVEVGGGEDALDHVRRDMEENGLSFPVLVREAGSHTGQTLRKYDTADEMAGNFPYDACGDLYVTQYVECLMRGRFFRKLRVFFVDGAIYPVVCHIDTVWNVHGDNRDSVMASNPWMMAEEEAFVTDPRGYLGPQCYELLAGLPGEIGLDFFGIDFTVMDDGTILVYEMNPVMRHKYDHARNFPYLRAHMLAITDAFGRMVAKRAGAK